MTKIVEYIMLNYTWFLIGAIIILLAIIGSYADKTNFGQGKDARKTDKNDLELEKEEEIKQEDTTKESMEDIIPDNMSEENEALSIETNELNKISEENNNDDVSITETNNDIGSETPEYIAPISSEELNNIENEDSSEKIDNINKNVELNAQTVLTDSNESETEKTNDFEENFNKFDEEFNTLLPKKDIIDDDLLDDIDNLSLDKTQKFNLSNIPDLDDVELPKIKNLKTEDENIWKF